MFGVRRAVPRGRGCAMCVVALLCGCQSRPTAPPSTGIPPLAETPSHSMELHPEHPPTSGAAGAALPEGHPALPESGDSTPPADAVLDPQSVIAGVLRLDDKLKSKVSMGDTIFLVARGATEGATPGPILAVKKMTASSWPL